MEEINGFILDLERNQKKERQKSREKQYSASVDRQLARAAEYLSNGEFEEAEESYEDILDEEEDCAEAMVGILLAKNHLRNMMDIIAYDKKKIDDAQFAEILIKQYLFDRAIETANSEYYEKLIFLRKSVSYYLAEKISENGGSIALCQGAAELWESIGDFQDARQRAEECRKNVEKRKREKQIQDEIENAEKGYAGEITYLKNNWKNRINIYQLLNEKKRIKEFWGEEQKDTITGHIIVFLALYIITGVITGFLSVSSVVWTKRNILFITLALVLCVYLIHILCMEAWKVWGIGRIKVAIPIILEYLLSAGILSFCVDKFFFSNIRLIYTIPPAIIVEILLFRRWQKKYRLKGKKLRDGVWNSFMEHKTDAERQIKIEFEQINAKYKDSGIQLLPVEQMTKDINAEIDKLLELKIYELEPVVFLEDLTNFIPLIIYAALCIFIGLVYYWGNKDIQDYVHIASGLSGLLLFVHLIRNILDGMMLS